METSVYICQTYPTKNLHFASILVMSHIEHTNGFQLGLNLSTGQIWTLFVDVLTKKNIVKLFILIRSSIENNRRMSMNDEQRLIVDILRLVSDTDSDVLNCLLLIQYICTIPDEEQCWNKVIKCNNGETLWNMIVKETDKADGHIFSAIKYAIDQIKAHLLFAANLAERLCTVVVDEYTLKAIVQMLLNISTDNDILSSVFEYNLIRKVQNSSPSSGDFYTPKQVVQWMTELLGIEHDGKVYDKVTPRLIQLHTLENAVKPPFLGGFFISGSIVAWAKGSSDWSTVRFLVVLCNDRKAIVTE